jgi:uncharacterized protein YbaR (Trm112 family)
MRKDLVEILACPICKSPLELTVAEESEDEVVRGHLTCKQCSEDYPIEDRIPNLLPPEDADLLMEGSQRLGAMIMLATVFEMVVFLWALSRRSYMAVALPIALILGALNVLGFWIGWTMFSAAGEDEEELEAALEEVSGLSSEP